MAESVASRYDREWLQLEDDRKVRTFDNQSEERREREFVDPATGETVTDVDDNSNGFEVTLSPA